MKTLTKKPQFLIKREALSTLARSSNGSVGPPAIFSSRWRKNPGLS
jgi:hypothetical protein